MAMNDMGSEMVRAGTSQGDGLGGEIVRSGETSAAAVAAKAQALDSAYSALRPLIRKREEVKPYVVHVIASYLDSNTNLTVTTVLPQNLRYETVGDVVALMKESVDVAGR